MGWSGRQPLWAQERSSWLPMTNPHQTPRRLRAVPVQWDALERAFENNAHEIHSYLHLLTGEVVRLVDGISEPSWYAVVERDPDYIRIEPVPARDQHGWMTDFVSALPDAELAASLRQAIRGTGAFRRFRDALASREPERNAWMALRKTRLRRAIDLWLEVKAITPVARDPERLPATSPPLDGQAAPDLVARPVGREVRARLDALIDALGPRELQALFGVAEFMAHGPAVAAAPDPAAWRERG